MTRFKASSLWKVSHIWLICLLQYVVLSEQGLELNSRARNMLTKKNVPPSSIPLAFISLPREILWPAYNYLKIWKPFIRENLYWHKKRKTKKWVFKQRQKNFPKRLPKFILQLFHFYRRDGWENKLPFPWFKKDR